MGQEHLIDALGEITRQLLALGARIIYGGDLRTGGITQMLFELAARYFPPSFRKNSYAPSVINVIPFFSHADLSRDELTRWEAEFATIGELRYMTRDGDGAWDVSHRPRNLAPLPRGQWPAALTAMRVYITHESDARVIVGGKTTGYLGRMPGIAEEALISITERKPLFVVGGFGGAAQEIARSIGATGLARFPGADRPTAVEAPVGLGEFECQRLATSPHVDEVALLITRGLRKLFDE